MRTSALFRTRLRLGLVLVLVFGAILITIKKFLIPFHSARVLTPSSPPVPNIVHFFHFVNKEKEGGHLPAEYNKDSNNSSKASGDLNFISATCILAAAFNQQPDRIIVHTNESPDVAHNLANKKYWSLLLRILNQSNKKDKINKSNDKNLLEISYPKQPSHVFGQPLSSTFHAADVARLSVLINQGGVGLDLDTFIVRKLDQAFFTEDTKVTLGNITFLSVEQRRFNVTL